ncbi:hypothetical protein CcCBS67573_g06619 [Chytriomyces confervae]|uniref:Uncharacterized protein n=1 Tax=Chytriomyces confervae TaxID=246404 RepID=A0A507F402_9FUNG|nr:hypothetical protein CcCBS67573_g06619 [Chytriomyces confervae]
MSKKGFTSPLFGKRKGSAAPSISDDQEAKRLAKKSDEKTSDRLDVLRNPHHSRVASVTSHTSRESATSNASSSLPPLAVSAHADISTMTAEKIKCATYLESRKLNSLQAAVHSGDLRKLRALVAEKGRDVNKLDTYHGFTALHLAVDENKYDAAVILMDSSLALADKNPLKVIDLNAVNREGRTALVIAVIRGFSDIVHLLVKRSASLHVQDVLGCTALHYAVCLGDVTAFKLLTDAGAKTDVVDKSGIPLFFHAIKNKRTPIAEKLLGNISAAEINQAYGTDHSTALHYAVQHSMISIVHALIEKGANPIALDAEKRKPVERIDYTDYDEELVDFLTLTEMSMFGSVTSFVEEEGTEAKSVLEIISKSVASLVSPKGSQSQLMRSEHPVECEPDNVEIVAPVIAQVSEQEQISSSFSVSYKDKSDGNTSPMLSYHDDELSVSDYGNDHASAEVHIVVPSAQTPDPERQDSAVPDTNQLAPQEMDMDSISVGPSVLSSSESQLSSKRASDKMEASDTKDESDASSQSASEPYASEIVLSDDESDEMMILPAGDQAVPQSNIQTAIEEAVCETEKFITTMFEASEPARTQVHFQKDASLDQMVDKAQNELVEECVREMLETDISPSSTAVSKEQYNEEAKDSAPKTWPIDASKSDACIETLQRELIDKNATIASLQQQIQSDAAAFQSRLDSLLAEQYKTNAEQQTNLDRTHVELTESKLQLQQSQQLAKDSTQNWQTRYANLEADLSQEQSHNSVLEFEMNDMFAKNKVIEEHAADLEQLLKTKDDKIAAMDLQNEQFIEQIALLQCEVVTLTEKLGATEKTLENETESRRILESKLEEGQVKNAEIIEELTAAVDVVELLQKKVHDLESKVSQLEQETQTAQTSHLENVHSQEQNERGFLSAQIRLQQELEAKEKLQRSNLKLETELSAMKTELAINKAIINSRDSQIESFRESLKDTSAHQAAQAMSDRCSEVASAEQSVKRATDDSIAKYYEAEISALNQRLNEEAAFRTAQKSESLQILTTITSLEDSLADIQSKYEEQSQKLTTAESLKNEALDGIQELRFNMEDLKSSHENQLKKRDDLIQEHLKTIHSSEKAAQDLKSNLAVIQKEKADIKKLRDESLAEYREKLRQLQNELQVTQQKNIAEAESLRTHHLAAISQVEDMLSASKKETAKAKQSLEEVKEDAVQLQKAVDAKNDYISNLEETVAQLESSNDSLRSLNQSAEQNQESLVDEIATLKLQHEQFIRNLKNELNESVGKYQTVNDMFETEKRNADSLSATVLQLEQQLHELQITSSQRISNLEIHVAEMNSHNENLKARMELLQNENEIVKSELGAEKAETSKNLTQIRNHQLNEDKLRESLEKSQHDLLNSTECLKTEKDAFAQFRKESEELVSKLQHEIQVFQQRTVEFEHRISEQCDQVRSGEHALAAQQHEIASLKNVILELQTSKLDLEVSLEAETVTRERSEQQVHSLHQKGADLETEMNTLRASLDSTKNTLEQMHDQRESMEKLIRHLGDTSVALESNKEALEQEVLELHRALEAQTSARQVSHQHVQSLQNTVVDLEAEVERRRASMDSTDKTLEQMHHQREAMEKRIRYLEDTSATLESMNDSVEREGVELQSHLKAELLAREQEVQSLQQKVVDLQAEVDRQCMSIESTEDTLERMREQREAMGKRIHHLEDTSATLESNKEALEKDVLKLQRSLEAEKSAGHISQQQVQLLQKTVVDLQAEGNKQLDQMRDQRETMETRIRYLEDASAALESKKGSLEQEVIEMQHSLETEQSERQTYQQQGQLLQKTIVDLEAEVERQRASLDSTDDTLERLQDEKQILEKRIRYLENTSATLEQEVIELKTQHSKLLAAHSKVNAAKEDLKLELDNLRVELSESQFELRESQDRVNVLSNDIKSVTNNVDTQIIQLKSQRDEAISELSSLKRELEKTHSDLSSAVQKTDHLEAELSDSQVRNKEVLEEMHDQRESMEKRIRYLEETSATLESKKESIESEAAELQSYLEAEMSAREQQVQSLQQKVMDLQAEVDGQRGSMESMDDTLEQMREQKEALEKRICLLEDTSATLESDKESLEQEALDLQYSLEAEQSARQISEQQLQLLQKTVVNLEAEIDRQNASMDSAKDTLEQMHDQREAMENRVLYLEEIFATLESDKESLEKEAGELKAQYSTLLSSHNEVSAAKEALQLDLDNLRGELNESQFKLRESQDRVNVLSNDVKSVTNNVDIQITQLKSQRDEANSDLSSLKRELENTRSDLSSAMQKTDHLETELYNSKTRSEQSSEKYNELKQSSSSLAAENQSLQDEIDDFHVRFERLESSFSQEAAEKNRLKSELDALSGNHVTCQEDIGKLILEIAGMAKTLDLQSMAFKSQKDRIQADENSLESLKHELNNAHENLADAMERMQNMEADLNEKSLRLSRLEKEVAAETERYSEMERKYDLSVSMESVIKNQLQDLESQVLTDNEAADAQKASLRDKLLELKSQLETASVEYQTRCDILQSSLSRETNENSSLKAELDSLMEKLEDLKQNLDESQSRESDLQQQLQVLRNAKAQDSEISNNDKASFDEESQELKLQLGAAKAEIEQLELQISKISTAFGEVSVENEHLKKESSNALGRMSAALETEHKVSSENAEYNLKQELAQLCAKNEQLMEETTEKDELIRKLENVTKQQADQIHCFTTSEESMRTLTDQRILSTQKESQQAAEAWNTRLELLETQVTRYESERGILMAQQEAYQQEIAQLENDMCESEREFDAVILEKSELERTVADQETAIAQYAHDKEDLTNHIFKMTSELEEARKSMHNNSQAASRLQKQHSEEIAQLQSELESMKAVHLSAEFAHKQETSVLKAQLSLNSVTEANVNSLKLENDQLSEKLAALSGKLESEKESLEADLADLKYTIDMLAGTKREMSEEVAELKNKESLQLERINTLELGVQKAEKENQLLESCLNASRIELQASVENLHESDKKISELVAEKDALTVIIKKNSVAIKDLESLSIYHQNELETMTSALKAETRKASKFEQISQQLSSLTNLPESPQRNDRNSASSQIESTETLAEEFVHTTSKKSHKAYSSKDGNVSAALRDLHLLMNQEVRAVVMKLTTLEDNINTDTVKMSTLIDEVNADQQVESDVKNIFTNVFGTQCERSIEAKSVLSSATKKTQSTLSLFEQDFVAIIADLEAKETRQKNEIANLESRCVEFQAQIQELKLNAHESEGKIKDSKMYIKKLEATAADLESSLIETESQLSQSDRSHKLSFEREKAAREHFERAFESLQNDFENLKSQRVQDKAAQQSLQAEVFDLGNTLDSAQKDLGTCRTENCRLNVLISSMKGQMFELENESSQKSSDLEKLKQQLFISAGQSSKSEEKSKQLQREIEQMKESLGGLETVQLEQLQMISTLKDQVFEGQEMLRLKDAECKQVRLDLAKTDFKVKNLEDQKEEMQSSLACSTRKVSQLQENLKTKIMAAESLSLKLEETEELLSKSQKDIAEQGATILKMSQRVTEITACMKEREELLGKLQSKIIVVESNQSNSDLEVRLLNQELESVRSQNAGLKESILARNKEIQHMQTQLQSYASKEANLTHLEAANELLRNEILALKKAQGAHGAIENVKIISNSSYPLQMSQTNENIETLQKESNNLKNLLASKDTQIRHMESEMRSYKAEASEANGKSSSLEQSIERLNTQVIELKGMLKTKDQAVTQLKLKDLKQQEVINQFEYEKLDLQGQLELLRAQVSHYTEAIETKWQPQHGSFQKRLNELSNSLQEANMSNSFLQNEISQLKNLQATPGRAVPNAPASLTDLKETQKIFESLASLKLELGLLRTTLNNSTESSSDILQHEGLQRILESFKTALHTLSSKIHDAELKSRVPASLTQSNDEETSRFKVVKAELISEIEALESKLRQSRRDHASAEDRVLLLEDKLQTSKNCTEQAQIDLQEAQHQLRLAASEIRGLKADRNFESIDPSTVNALKADNVKLQDSLNSLKFQAEREILSLMREVSEHEGQISKLKEDLSQSSALTQRYEYHIQNLQWTLKIQTEAHEETKASLSHESQTVRRLKLSMEEMQKKSTTETAPDLTQGNTYQVVSTPKNVLEVEAHRQQIKFWKKKVQKLQAQVEAANELYDSKLDTICSKLEQSAIQWHQAELSLVQAVDHTTRDDRIRLLKTDLKSIIRSINA